VGIDVGTEVRFSLEIVVHGKCEQDEKIVKRLKMTMCKILLLEKIHRKIELICSGCKIKF
jgi:hypothetical protein